MADTIENVYFGSRGASTNPAVVGDNGVGGVGTTQVLEAWASDDPRYLALAAQVSAAQAAFGPGIPAGLTAGQVYAQFAVGASAAGSDPRDSVCYLGALRAILGL